MIRIRHLVSINFKNKTLTDKISFLETENLGRVH